MSIRSIAVVVGGSNGIGLGITKELLSRGWRVKIVDVVKPDLDLNNNLVEYVYSDLLDYDEELFDSLAHDLDVQCLVMTAGVGRVASFENLHISEIERTMQINAVSLMRIIKQFYLRIHSKDVFLCGMMGSITGYISSPLFSVYAASKAALCRFAESVNVELEADHCKNRILVVNPGRVAGTKFEGEDQNHGELVVGIARSFVKRMELQELVWIPQWDETYREVLERYQSNPQMFGLQSYQYKLDGGRINNNRQAKIGYLSGTFDLFHVGHLNLIRRAKGYCDYLIVGVHESGLWKGKDTYIPFDERLSILRACKYVDKAVLAPKEDSDAWNQWHYNLLFVGSDYKGTERFQRYERVLGKRGVRIVYFPYTKGTSSTQIRDAIASKAIKLDQ